MPAPKFYVYEHVRQDTGKVFYVGKGSGNRYRIAKGGRRNCYWWKVARKAGWAPRIVFRTDDEELAFLAEVELIDKHRRIGSPLTNATDGGEGPSGHRHSDETKQLLRRKACITRGDDNPSRRPEVRRRISEAQRAMGENHPTKRPEARRRMSAAAKGRKPSPETRAKLSESRMGIKNHFFGRHHSRESVELMRKHATAAIPVTCPHCGKTGGRSVMQRWHFDRCREVAV